MLGSIGKTAVALALAAVGSIGFYNVWVPWERRIGPGVFRGGLVLVGPFLMAIGVSVLVLGVARRFRAGTVNPWPLRMFRAGVVMLLIGGFPWVYTPLICGTSNHGASGMLGTVLFLLVGLPGIAVSGVGLLHAEERGGETMLDGT